MAESFVSKKKVEYLDSLRENLATTKENTIKTVEEIISIAKKAKTACAYKTANVMAKVANAQLTVIASAGKGGTEMAQALQEGSAVGPALVREAKRIEDEISPLAVKADDIPLFSDSVIDESGLEENWGVAVQQEFSNACMAFVQVRANSIRDISETTQKVLTGDFDEVYKKFGKNLETDFNDIARIFNTAMTVFESAGINIAKMQADAKQSAASVGNTDVAGTVGAIEEI